MNGAGDEFGLEAVEPADVACAVRVGLGVEEELIYRSKVFGWVDSLTRDGRNWGNPTLSFCTRKGEEGIDRRRSKVCSRQGKDYPLSRDRWIEDRSEKGEGEIGKRWWRSDLRSRGMGERVEGNV